MNATFDDPRSPHYRQDMESDQGANCSTCLWFRVDRNDIPYQGGTVIESEDWKCELGYKRCDCPPGTWQPKPKARPLDWDWVHDLLEEIRREEEQERAR